MRKGIFIEKDGKRIFDVAKIIGTSYGNGWFTNCSCRYRLFKGARNTKKSYDMIGYETIMKILSNPDRNILIVRKNDSDNRHSTFSTVNKCISDLGLESYFKVTTQPLEITLIATGQKILFFGMNNPTQLNSINFVKGYLSDVYCEECFEIDSWDAFLKLDQSVRAGMEYDDDGNLIESDRPQQITMCFNAWSDQTWLYTEFFKGRLEDDPEYLETHKYMDYYDPDFIGPGGTGLYMHISTYKANEFRNKKQIDVAAEEMKKKNPDLYRTLFLGCWGCATATVFPEFNSSCIISDQQIRDEYVFSDFAIGIDTGLSSGEGKKITVKKGEDAVSKVKSATVVILTGITPGFKKIVAIDEYYHSNDYSSNSTNTDNRDNLNISQLGDAVMNALTSWMRKYGSREKKGDILCKGICRVWIDSADVGFCQIMTMKAREFGVYNVVFGPSTKTSIQGRIDFARLMFSYGDMLISENCPNLIREIKNARRGAKGEARENIDDHAQNSFEYSYAPFRNSFARWKNNFKEH